MKKSVLFLLSSVIVFTSFVGNVKYDTECNIYSFYISKHASVGSKGLTYDGEIVELDKILIPFNELKDGTYRVSITEVSDDYYSIDGTDLFFESTICLEPSISDDVIIKIENMNGFTFGTVIFLE